MDKTNLAGYPSIDKLWMKYYSEEDQVYEIPDCSIYENMYKSSQKYGNQVCLEYVSRKIKLQVHCWDLV